MWQLSLWQLSVPLASLAITFGKPPSGIRHSGAPPSGKYLPGKCPSHKCISVKHPSGNFLSSKCSCYLSPNKPFYILANIFMAYIPLAIFSLRNVPVICLQITDLSETERQKTPGSLYHIQQRQISSVNWEDRKYKYMNHVSHRKDLLLLNMVQGARSFLSFCFW